MELILVLIRPENACSNALTVILTQINNGRVDMRWLSQTEEGDYNVAC